MINLEIPQTNKEGAIMTEKPIPEANLTEQDFYNQACEYFRYHAEQRTTMIIVTHEMAFARDVADQLIFMDQGFIVEQGDPHQVIDHPREERTRHFLAHYSET
jgi:polar amino acid transport system ATP-binding protein